MQTYQVETVISEEGVLNITGLPLHPGEKVEVTVKTKIPRTTRTNRYPLHGKPIHYEAPFDSVAETDWDIL